MSKSEVWNLFYYINSLNLPYVLKMYGYDSLEKIAFAYESEGNL